MAEELPPLIAEIIGDASQLFDVLDDVEARLTAFARQDFTANLGLNIDRLMGSLEEAESALDAFDRQTFDAKLGLNVSEALAELAAFEHVVEAQTVTVPLTLDMAPALAQLAELRGLSSAAGAGGGGGGRGGSSFLGTAAGAAAGGAAQGGLLGFGTKLLPTIPVAGFGTLGAAAGFGAESIAGLAAGLVGFAAHGILGGLALGLTSAVTTGVGALTDNAGIGQALGDVKQYGSLTGNLKQAAAVYGTGSLEYKLAQYQYGQWAQTLSPGYIKAVSRANTEKTAFGAQFDKDTSPAATTGANIITSLLKTGQTFLPTIGKFAAENMDIIQKSLKPLQTWLAGPGLKAFTQIEQVFSAHLPTAMAAFDQGFELLLRTVAHFAPQTGGLMKFFDNLFTRLNGPGFDKFIGEVQGAINAFREWEKFGKAVITMIDELFKHDAKTGEAVIESLTRLIGKFNDWANTVAGGDKLHDYMEAHKNEVLQLVGLFGNLISIMGQVHLSIGPPLMEIVGDLLKFVNLLLEIPGVDKITAYVIAFELLGRHMSILAPLLKAFNGYIRTIALDGLHLLGGAITALGGPFEKLGGWLTGIGTNTPAAQMKAVATSLQSTADSMAGIGEVMTTAADAMTEAATQMSAAAATIERAFAGIGTAAEGAAAEVETSAAEMDTALESTGAVADTTAAQVDVASGSEGAVGAAGGAGFLAKLLGKGKGAGTTAAEGAGEDALFAGVSLSVMPALLGLGGVQLYNGLLEKKLSKVIGKGPASALGDIGTGAAIGSVIGPEGAIGGALAGLVVAALGTGKPGKNSPLNPAFPHSTPGLGSNAPHQTPGGGVSPTAHPAGYNPKFPFAGNGPGTAYTAPHQTASQSALAKDSTLQKQLAAIQVLAFNAESAKSKDGANSSAYKAALKSLQSTEQKYLPTLGKDVSLKGVDNKIALMKGNITELTNTAKAAQPYILQLDAIKTTLATQKGQLSDLVKGGASKDSIDQLRGEVKNTETHMDAVKSVVQDGANATKQIKSDTTQLNKLQNLQTTLQKINTDTGKLHSDLTPLTTGVTISKLPPQAMKASGAISLRIS